ncbi:MAG: serine/threonine protein kinase, partial [Pseudomonadota bacterium]
MDSSKTPSPKPAATAKNPGSPKPPPVRSPSSARDIQGLKGVRRVGRYEIARELDRGGMAVIYLGWDPYIKRNVAIKISQPGTQKARERFFVEAQSVGRLSHPNVVALYDA